MPASASPRTAGQSAALDRLRERKAAAEQEQHVPRNASQVRPGQQGAAFLRAILYQEQEEPRQQRDRRVVELRKPGQLTQERAGDPGSAVTTKTAVTRRSAVVIGPRAARASMRRSRAMACEPSWNGKANLTSTSQAIGIRSRTVGIPNASHCGEADGLAVVLLHEANDERIGRGADERAEAADGRGVGDAEDDRRAEVPRVAIVRCRVRGDDRRDPKARPAASSASSRCSAPTC